MSVVTVATIRPVPEHRAEVVAVLEATIARVHEEDGCELYALHEDADTLVLIEKWTSAQALQEHRRGSAMSQLMPQLAGKLQSPPVAGIYAPHPTGSLEKGAV